MAYSLDAKIISYLAGKGIADATMDGSTLVIGDFRHVLRGFVTSEKLDRIVAEYRASADAPA